MMRRARQLAGVFSILCAVAALNAVFWVSDPFSLPVTAPLALSALLGLAWLGITLFAYFVRGAAEERSLGGLNAAVSTVAFLGICVVAYLFVQSWDAKWDLTKEGRRDLSPLTVQVLRNITQPVDVICFFLDVDDELVVIARDKTLRFLEQCGQHTDQLQVEVLDPTVERGRVEELKITHASTQGTVVVRAGDRQRVITLSGGSPRLEEREFTNALINVLRDTEPKVSFLGGHQERDPAGQDERGLSGLVQLLTGESFALDRLNIKLAQPEVPKDVDVLVIANPQTDLHPLEIEALDAFVDAGGRLLVLMDPWRAPPQGAVSGEQLRPWLARRFGITVGSDLVVTDASSNKWQAELSYDGKPFEGVDAGFMEYQGCYHKEHPVTKGFDQTMLLQALRSVRLAEKPPAGVAGVELLRTTPDFWAETDTAKLLETGQAKRDEADAKGPIPVAAAVQVRVDQEKSPKGRADARVVVVGDADFATNGQITVPGHLNFLMNAFAWMNESEELIAIRPTGAEAAPLILTDMQRRAAAWVAVMCLVQAVAAAGLLARALRGRHQ